MKLKAIFVCAAIAATIGCGGKKNPGPGPTPVSDPPKLTCPSTIELFAHEGQPQPSANFDAPTATGGESPVNVTCTPGSGTEFPNGQTTVLCEAVDRLTRKASCTFLVNVTLVPKLEKTKFLAFGDSITEGKAPRLTKPGLVFIPPKIFNESGSYVDDLNAKLEARYLDQTVTIVADGLGAEKAGDGKLRLERDWTTYSPDALLVVEGINDLLSADAFTPAGMQSAMDSVTDALRRMIQFARGRRARVFVGTLTPVTLPKENHVIAAVPVLNERIRAVAAAEGATLVDLYAAVPTDLVGRDGLHLTPAGYQAMADEWLKAIIATMELKPSAPSTLR